MSADDLPLAKRWPAMPHVTSWWGNADEQFELVGGDLAHPAMDQFIVAKAGRPATPRLVTDPDPANERAVRAYEKAGFRRHRMVDTPDGPALLMLRNGGMEIP